LFGGALSDGKADTPQRLIADEPVDRGLADLCTFWPCERLSSDRFAGRPFEFSELPS